MSIRGVLGRAQATYGRPVRFELLPGHGDSAWRQNSEVFARSQVLSLDDAENTRYVVGWQLNGSKAAIWRWQDSTGWEIFNLTEIGTAATNRPFYSTSGVDHHNYMVCGVDPEGRVIVGTINSAGGDKFAYSGADGDLSTWTWSSSAIPDSLNAVLVSNGNADRYLYPQLWNWPISGDLAMQARFGSSGEAVEGFLAWDDATQTWAHDFDLIDGTGDTPAHSAYHTNIYVDQERDRVWYSWMWRDDGSTQYANYNVYAVYTDDDGATWNAADGTAMTLPINASNAADALALDTGRWSTNAEEEIPGLTLNGLAVDVDGNPHIAHQRFDDKGMSQAEHTYFDGTDYQTEQVTNLSWRSVMAQDTQRLSRLGIVCTQAGRTFIVGRATTDGHGNRPVLWECTPGSANHGRVTVLADIDLGYYEPSIDYSALERGDDTLRMILTPARPMPELWQEPQLIANSSRTDGLVSVVTPNWNEQWVGLLDVDLSRVDEIDRGHLPSERTLTSSTLGPATTTSEDAMADLTSSVTGAVLKVPVFSELVRAGDRVIRARMVVSAKVDDAAKRGYLSLVLVNARSGTERVVQYIGYPFEADLGDGRPQGINKATYRTYATEWTPLPIRGDDWDDGGYLKLQGGLDVAGTLSIENARIDLGELVDSDGLPGRRPWSRRIGGDPLNTFPDLLLDIDPQTIGADLSGTADVATMYNAADALRMGRYTLTEATNRPQRIPNAITVNGKSYAVLRFNGTNDRLATTETANTGRQKTWKGAWTAVYVWENAAYGTAFRTVFMWASLAFGLGTTGKIAFQKIGGSLRDGGSAVGVARHVAVISYGGPTSLGGSGKWTLSLDGTQVHNGTGAGEAPDSALVGGEGVALGNYSGGTGFFNGDLIRCGVIGHQLTATGREALADAFATKYGIA